MQLKPQFRLWLHCSDVASRHAYCIRNLHANFLRRLTGCYMPGVVS
jgi:hypothetical protein